MEALQHRSYRKIIRTGLPFWIEIGLLSVVSILSILLYTMVLHNYFVEFFYYILTQSGFKETLITLPIYRFDLLVIDVPFAYNQITTLFIGLVASIGIIAVLMYQRIIPLNVVFWVSFLLLLSIIFILYFMFFGSYFPYSAEKYFDLYLHAYIGFMLMCFIVLSFSLALTPMAFSTKALILTSSIIYYFIYSFIRYALTVVLVSEISVVFSPLMYFTIFYDFIIIIYIYTLVLYRNTAKLQKGENHG